MCRSPVGRPWSWSLRTIPARPAILDLCEGTTRTDLAHFTHRCDRNHPESSRSGPTGCLSGCDVLIDAIRHWLAGVQGDDLPSRLGGVWFDPDRRVLLTKRPPRSSHEEHDPRELLEPPPSAQSARLLGTRTRVSTHRGVQLERAAASRRL